MCHSTDGAVYFLAGHYKSSNQLDCQLIIHALIQEICLIAHEIAKLYVIAKAVALCYTQESSADADDHGKQYETVQLYNGA
jgi:hypothetical protein